MWLLSTSKLDLHYFQDVSTIRYAILSHTWEEEEVSFQEMQVKDSAKAKKGYKKIEKCCQQARVDGYEYAWVDTCCIDKSSSAELSEAINSMFNWYATAAVCYVYLSDVKWLDHTLETKSLYEHLRPSRWFTRGWTMQELIAPLNIRFFAKNWKELGTKLQFCRVLHRITRIDQGALLGRPLKDFNVGERMSWAAGRVTTRIEDRAYSLFGIFDINLPLLYGEGDYAFIRLQEQILETTEDYSIFAWADPHSGLSLEAGFFAPSADHFIAAGVGASESKWTYSELEPVPGVLKQQYGGVADEQEQNVCPAPPSVTSRGIKMQGICQRLIGTHPQNQHSRQLLLCPLRDSDLSSKRWLATTIQLPTVPHGITTRMTTELYITSGMTMEVLDIYARKAGEVPRQMTSVGTRYGRLLELAVAEPLKSLTSLDQLQLARKLNSETWCATCCSYTPHNHRCRLNSRVASHRARARTKAAKRGAMDQMSTSIGAGYSSGGSGSSDSEPSSDPDASDNDGADPTSELDSTLFKLATSLSAIHGRLQPSLEKFLLCCCVAMARAKQAEQSLIVQKRKIASSSRKWLLALGESLNQGHRVGCFAIAFCTNEHFCTDECTSTCEYAGDDIELALILSVIELSKIFVDDRQDDRAVVALAEAIYFHNYGLRDAVMEQLLALGSKAPQCGKRHDCFGVIEQFAACLGPRPSVDSELCAHVRWLRSGFETWLSYTTPKDLEAIFQELYKRCWHAGALATMGINDNMSSMSLIFKWYTPYIDQEQTKEAPQFAMCLRQSNYWQALEHAVMEDVVSNGPPKLAISYA